MIGLEYILQATGMQGKELAEQLGINKQNTTLWISGKQKIPKKHLPILERIFKIPQDYFQKELTEIDKLEIQKIKLDQDLSASAVEYEDTVYDYETGEYINIPQTYYDSGIVEHLRCTEEEIQKFKVLKKIDNIISEPPDEPECFEDVINQIDARTELFNRFADIVKSNEVERQLLHEVMRAIELTSESLSRRNKILGKGRRDSKAVEDERPIVQKLYEVMHGHISKERKELTELIKELEENKKPEDDELY